MTSESFTNVKKEKFFFYNSLAVLLKAVEGERTTVDLRNEASIYGTVEQADGFMNIVMKDCIFTDPRGDRFSYEIFFVQARNIRYVHIPPNIPIIPAIKSQLRSLSGKPDDPKSLGEKSALTFKAKRAQEQQRETKEAVERLLKEKREKPASDPGE